MMSESRQNNSVLRLLKLLDVTSLNLRAQYFHIRWLLRLYPCASSEISTCYAFYGGSIPTLYKLRDPKRFNPGIRYNCDGVCTKVRGLLAEFFVGLLRFRCHPGYIVFRYVLRIF